MARYDLLRVSSSAAFCRIVYWLVSFFPAVFFPPLFIIFFLFDLADVGWMPDFCRPQGTCSPIQQDRILFTWHSGRPPNFVLGLSLLPAEIPSPPLHWLPEGRRGDG